MNRADFLDQALSYRPLADALQHNDLKLSQMNNQELQAVFAVDGDSISSIKFGCLPFSSQTVQLLRVLRSVSNTTKKSDPLKSLVLSLFEL